MGGWRIVFWVLAILLLWWALREIPLAEVGAVLQRLRATQLVVLMAVNTGIVLLMGARWWLILRVLGYTIPYVRITRYRLAAFGVSYFTPGPQFGGEPLQVLAVQRGHGVPGTTAAAALGLDKLFELLANFSFLVLGVGVVLRRGVFGEMAGVQVLPLAAGLLSLPLGYLVAVWSGWRPITRMLGWLPERVRERGGFEGLVQAVRHSEGQMAAFCRQQPRAVAQALGLSVTVWLALIFEYWLALRFLGLPLDLWQVVSVMTAARAAMLTPMPGALGALETGQVLAMEAMGFDPAVGVSLSLLIRARDLVFGGAGLWWGIGGMRSR